MRCILIALLLCGCAAQNNLVGGKPTDGVIYYYGGHEVGVLGDDEEITSGRIFKDIDYRCRGDVIITKVKEVSEMEFAGFKKDKIVKRCVKNGFLYFDVHDEDSRYLGAVKGHPDAANGVSWEVIKRYKIKRPE
jgi:hypothetical protein